jgi:hypothetical protein
MAEYKQPKKVASPKVGQADVKKTLSEPISDATLRSGEFKPTKTSGIKTRGNGCAQRGVTARGPMA